MLKIIKTSYFIKQLFLYIDERQKLKLIRNNKRLQRINDIKNK